MKYYIMFHGVRKDGKLVSGYGRQFNEEELGRAEHLCRVFEQLTNVPHFVAETE